MSLFSQYAALNTYIFYLDYQNVFTQNINTMLPLLLVLPLLPQPHRNFPQRNMIEVCVADCGTRRLLVWWRRLGVLINTAAHSVQTGDKERGHPLSRLAAYCTCPERLLRQKSGSRIKKSPAFKVQVVRVLHRILSHWVQSNFYH